MNPLNLIEENNYVVAELEITINNKEVLKVDIIEFDDKFKILSIKSLQRLMNFIHFISFIKKINFKTLIP